MGERKENRFTARKLPQTKLGDHIEKRINEYMKNDEEAGYVHIRVVSSQKKNVIVQTHTRDHYPVEDFPDKFPYTQKSLFAFQESDGDDVCFFGMYTQEFDSDCPEPNRNRVYISFLDSVYFFKPRRRRTGVYFEILNGYFEFCKNRG